MLTEGEQAMALGEAKKITDTLWEIPKSYRKGMRVPVRIYATEALLARMDPAVVQQAANVACLPGIVGYSFCMPDGHSGYGFPIGGAAAFDPDEGVISPGGIGFDINCGMRLVATSLTWEEVEPRIEQLVDRLFAAIPAGVGGRGFVKISKDEFRTMAEQGMRWCLKKGYALKEDLERTEEGGCLAGADAAAVSDRAVERGFQQIGTLGSGNHYLEVQVARPENVFDRKVAESLGIRVPNQVLLMFHCGSRGFGHQVATDYLQKFLSVMQGKYGIQVLDRQLACAPFRSPEGQDYFKAMKCAVNMSFVNRQVILHRIREVFGELFGRDPMELGLHQVYDVTHNTAKVERHVVPGERRSRELVIHRKGATRAFAPGMEDLPAIYRKVGQPVIIGGSMETGSYLMVGVQTGAETFYTTAHGSGRAMGRHEAKRRFQGRELERQMRERGIYVRSVSAAGLAEEAGAAYKNIDEVVEATELAGLSRRVARLVPVGNIKG
jgi:tRNA-splicing ligase RtcB